MKETEKVTMPGSNVEMQAFWDAQALFWDQCVRPQRNDVAFFVDEARRSGSPVLEIGCGSGRSLIPIAEAGVDIVGLDISAAMLSRARSKVAGSTSDTRGRIDLVQGDMHHFAFARRFKLILVTYAFVFLTSVAEQRQALGCMARHLAPEGRLIITNPDPQADIIADHLRPTGTGLKEPRIVQHPLTGLRILVRSSRQYDPLEQTIRSTFAFETLDEEGGVVSRKYKHLHSRYTYRYEMQHLLELCGFTVDALYGDFQRKPFASTDTQIWVLSHS